MPVSDSLAKRRKVQKYLGDVEVELDSSTRRATTRRCSSTKTTATAATCAGCTARTSPSLASALVRTPTSRKKRSRCARAGRLRVEDEAERRTRWYRRPELRAP